MYIQWKEIARNTPENVIQELLKISLFMKNKTAYNRKLRKLEDFKALRRHLNIQYDALISKLQEDEDLIERQAVQIKHLQRTNKEKDKKLKENAPKHSKSRSILQTVADDIEYQSAPVTPY